MKQAIQTNLLGTKVIIGDATGTVSGPTHEAANREGTIRNVYTDRDGDLKYTIQVSVINKLIELYPSSFRIAAPYGD